MLKQQDAFIECRVKISQKILKKNIFVPKKKKFVVYTKE